MQIVVPHMDEVLWAAVYVLVIGVVIFWLAKRSQKNGRRSDDGDQSRRSRHL
ncbi:hypothetical protein [Brachybacterium phenoliresistens]|uniref:hypothetical protein n=1 Tax=Brachybacterium phenoliresistens TaxID=396014 RepID=UPI0031DC5779